MNDASLKISHIDLIADGILIRFSGATEDFNALITELKAKHGEGVRWRPAAFNDRGGWLLPLSVLLTYRHVFQNLEECLKQFEEQAETGIRMNAQEAFDYLHLRTSAPLPLVKAAYRILAQSMHPDHGGDHVQMVALNAAYEVASTYAEGEKA